MSTPAAEAQDLPPHIKGKFKTRAYNRQPGAWFKRNPERPPGDRSQPGLVVLAPEAGVVPDERPPVRIYLGTEPAQYRAERVFVWSIAKHRNRARRYEIYLMSNLKGFDRSTWKTGFTNYRYAIPALAGYEGRAIYNDVDQIYFSDPAELFDCDMEGNAVLSIDHRETSVMLLDCEALKELWPLEDAQGQSKHKQFRARVHDAGKWGHMDRGWNSRDDEYEEGRSKLLHFTTLHRQPWRPFPELLRYQPNDLEHLWFDLEAEADAAGFTLFTEDNPSIRYGELLEMYGELHDEGRPDTGHTAQETFKGHSLTEHIEPIARLIEHTSASTLLDYGCGKATLYDPAAGEPPTSRFKKMDVWGDVHVTCFDPGYEPYSGPYDDRYDAVITTDVLEHIPAEDIPWVLDHLFSRAGKFLYAVAACFPAKKILPDGTNAHCTLYPPEWWWGQMQAAERRNPGVQWVLCTQEKSWLAFEQRKNLAKMGIRNRHFSCDALDGVVG